MRCGVVWCYVVLWLSGPLCHAFGWLVGCGTADTAVGTGTWWSFVVPAILYHSLFDVGSPLTAALFACLLIACVHECGSGSGSGSVGRVLNRVAGWQIWYTPAQLNFWIYLFHPAVHVKVTVPVTVTVTVIPTTCFFCICVV